MDHPKNIVKRGRYYYLRVMVDGKRLFRSLKTSNQAEAKIRAGRMIKHAEAGRFDILDRAKSKKGFAKLGKVFEVYRKAAATRDMRQATAENYIRSLRVVISKARGSGKAGELSTAILTRDLVEKYAETVLDGAGSDERSRERARRTIRSTLRQARALFSGWAMDAYRDLKLPDLAGFMKAEGAQNMAVTYHLPPQALRDKTLKEGRKLREKKPDLYAVFLLCYDVGLRAGEASQTKWSWLRLDRSGETERCYLDVIKREDFTPKGKERSIPLGDEVARHLNALRSDGSDFVLPGTSLRARDNLVKRNFAG